LIFLSARQLRALFFIYSFQTTDYIHLDMNTRLSHNPVIAIIGHLVKDEIKTLDGRLRVGIGGTAYNLAALAAVQLQGKIYPVCRIGSDIKCLSDELFSLSPRFDLSGVSYVRRPNAIHRLTYKPDGSRSEWNSGKQMPLELDSSLFSCDALLLNFISGNDVKLSELQALKKHYRGLIYCDYHSLSLGLGRDKMRFIRYHPRWRDYLSVVDIIQMNLIELSSIFRKKTGSFKAAMEALELLHRAGPPIAIITAGRDGVILSQRPEGRYYHIPAVKIKEEVDATGCGDTLSASFLYHYLISGNIVGSLETANHYAAAKATFSGLAGFAKFEKIKSKIGRISKAERIFGVSH
jgi:sugar/nucleoside kinase (ribokinase family)